MDTSDKKLTYRDAGVDIDAGNKAVDLMKGHVRATYRKEVLGDIGGFGGLFALDLKKYPDPVLVSGTDGVGTKLRLAFMMDKHDTIGQDAVAMCVNDVLVQGAEPLFFLDYLAVGKLNPDKVATIVSGVAKACKESGCSLIGGETAEMPGFYPEGEYDIAGFGVGVANREQIITGDTIAAGDVMIGLPSSGVHSNGFSLVRKICFMHKKLTVNSYIEEFQKNLGEELLTPTRLYPKVCLPVINKYKVKGMVHITGGGFYDNIPRILPVNCSARVEVSAWPKLPVFDCLRQWGDVPWPEMFRTFNMGIGMIMIVSPEDADAVQRDLISSGEKAYVIGHVMEGKQEVLLEGGVFNG